MRLPNELLGEYLESNYLKMIRTIERKVCKCFRGKTDKEIKKKYPECLFIEGTLREVGDYLVDAYWEVIISHFKKRYPATLMEVYLLQEFNNQ